MKSPQAPHLDERREEKFAAELRERAQAWNPKWGLADGESDFGRALLKIAARFNSEVAERLDRTGEKMRRGFLDWLGIHGKAARPARLPVVFKLADTAQEAVLAPAPVQMQADAAGTPVVFETEREVHIVPGSLAVVVGADPGTNAFYLWPPGLSDLQPLEQLPARWQLKSFAAAGAAKLQLNPELGLADGMILETEDQQYRVVGEPKDGLVTIEPRLATDLPESTSISKVTTFKPFDGAARNRQKHALYLGDGDLELLNIEAAAMIDVVGATASLEDCTWEYWGKTASGKDSDWQRLSLASKQAPDAVTLQKPEGAVEPKEIEGRPSRWIRALKTKVQATEQPFRADEFGIRINYSTGCTEAVPCPPEEKTAASPSAEVPANATPVDEVPSPPVAEALANTTPLVLENVFYPLGKEPKQFDAFYLGSQEAFSKKDANVQLCFEMADRTFAALSAVRGGAFDNRVLAGVGNDRALHLLGFEPKRGGLTKFREREILQPPLPGYEGKAEPGNNVALDQQPRWRLPVWSESDGFLVAASAGDAIWVWHEKADDNIRNQSGWRPFGSILATDTLAPEPVAGLVYLAEAGQPQIVALRNKQLFVRQWPDGPHWDSVKTVEKDRTVLLESIVPFLEEKATGLITSSASPMVGVSQENMLYTVTFAGICEKLLDSNVDKDVRPVAVRRAGGELVIAAVSKTSPRILVMYHSGDRKEAEIPLDEADARVVGLEAVSYDDNGVLVLNFLASVQTSVGSYLASWTPPNVTLFRVPVPIGPGTAGGSPTEIARHVVIPGAHADILVSEFDPKRRRVKSASVQIGVVVPDSIPPLAVNDLIVLSDGNSSPAPVRRLVTQAGFTHSGEVFYPINSEFPASATGQIRVYKKPSKLAGKFTSPNTLTLDSGDHETEVNSWLLIDDKFYTVDDIDKNGVTWKATISSPFSEPMPKPGRRSYILPIATRGRLAPFMRLDPTGNGDWDAGLLSQIQLIFPGKTPEKQWGQAFSVAPGNKPDVVVLKAAFQNALGSFEFLLDLDAAFGEWHRDLGDTSTNPELSWEYWNGRGWWKLGVSDQTLHLKTTGSLSFKIPDDIAASDWAGKTNYWIRARLIGGDYGREKVTVKISKPDPVTGETTQTIERTSEGIRAPSVLRLHISYGICDAVPPQFVLTQDSGSFRDQSDANRTPGAIVEAFVPLAETLRRLSNAAASLPASNACPPECNDRSQQPASTQTLTGTAPAPAPSGASGRALFIGLAATPSEAPVNVLLLVDECEHAAFAPMTIEALVADHFVPIVADDSTRALGESGLLSMTFDVPPTPSDLFGQKGLTWLRLTPKAGANSADWKPSLRGAYLNAVWASATETMTRELLGSSDGAPNMSVRLARPPVLDHTLELRVKEPLGDEERIALRKTDKASVLTEVDGLSGDWVLWKQVTNPVDEPADARVYALDEATGEIRFGDGWHGRIPPIGRDAIVAFSYKRTESGSSGSATVPGNTITARTALNLVSPVATVESVTAADQGAGGARPEDDDRVLRFGYARLRHRDRAVTLHDLEDLAVQSSPDIVQARALVRRGSIRLVVVMKGSNPAPAAAQVRELSRLLLASAPVSLSAPNALQVKGPEVRSLRIELHLRVETLDHAGDLGRYVKARLADFFDTATGGIDRDGWALGLSPNEDDIAFALLDAPYLDSIEKVTLREIVSGESEQLWPATLKPAELVMLAKDPIRIQFETAEVVI